MEIGKAPVLGTLLLLLVVACADSLAGQASIFDARMVHKCGFVQTLWM